MHNLFWNIAEDPSFSDTISTKYRDKANDTQTGFAKALELYQSGNLHAAVRQLHVVLR